MTNKENFDFSFKLLAIGETGVGKTCIILRYTDDIFLRNQMTTIGIDFRIKKIRYHQKSVKLLIWDTAGQERFRNITNQYYNGADGILLVFDVTKRETFEKVTYWMNQICYRSDKGKVGIVLVGNKVDEEKRTVSKDEGELFSRNNGITYMETSALTNLGIDEVFDYVLKEIFIKKGIVINNTKKTDNVPNIQLNNLANDTYEKCAKC